MQAELESGAPIEAVIERLLGSGIDAETVGGVIGAGILWALDSRNCPIRELERVASWMAGESAGQCGPCRFGLPKTTPMEPVMVSGLAQISSDAVEIQ